VAALGVVRAISGSSRFSGITSGTRSGGTAFGARWANLGFNNSLTTEWLAGAGAKDTLEGLRVPISLKHAEHRHCSLSSLAFIHHEGMSTLRISARGERRLSTAIMV